ncbi:MAG: hypothetical protein J3Q66DRAFT_310048 [Benniella sp.]|nr:MAG: hypothetical protein J3Q66DRAFT_310048 [Benniella sp.]
MADSSYIVKDTPSKGRGMFATRNIKRGECIIAESPLLYVRHNSSMTGNTAAVEALSKKNKKYFYALHNAFADELSQDAGIIRTNALPLGPESLDGAVYRVISRINHSCAPNANQNWNARTNKEYIYAIKDIPEDSEILITYTSLMMTRAGRQKDLQEKFRFTCRCEVCDVESSEEYDAAVRRIDKCSDLIQSCMNSRDPRKSIGYVREILALLDKIGGRGKTPYYDEAFQICAQYSNYTQAKEWADLFLESHRMEEGEDDEVYEEYLAYSQNPRSFERAGIAGYVNLDGA